ncbi:MAG: hypothetical protein EOS02_09850 [Mesorhizobium sp.]|nr:MAG: hypothetical protein EOS02_09850 [Mesorhizobium sp.]
MDDLRGKSPAETALAEMVQLATLRRRHAEQWVRDRVMVQTFRDLAPATTGAKLAASHYQLETSVSHLALNRARLSS